MFIDLEGEKEKERERETETETERDRDVNQLPPPVHAPTRDQICNLLVSGMMCQPTETPGQGSILWIYAQKWNCWVKWQVCVIFLMPLPSLNKHTHAHTHTHPISAQLLALMFMLGSPLGVLFLLDLV